MLTPNTLLYDYLVLTFFKNKKNIVPLQVVGVKRHLVDSEFEGAVKEAPDTAFNFAYDLVVSDGSKKVRFSSFFLT